MKRQLVTLTGTLQAIALKAIILFSEEASTAALTALDNTAGHTCHSKTKATWHRNLLQLSYIEKGSSWALAINGIRRSCYCE